MELTASFYGGGYGFAATVRLAGAVTDTFDTLRVAFHTDIGSEAIRPR
ncbi:MAG: hypothetical protein ACRDZQ_13855 [Acidimicrobiales bacterium]